MAKPPEQQGRARPVCLWEALICILESAPPSLEVCLSFSVNKGSELSLLWKTLQSYSGTLHFSLAHAAPTSVVLPQSKKKKMSARGVSSMLIFDLNV